MNGFQIEFTFRMDDDPCEYYEAVGILPGQDERYQRLLDLMEGPIELHDGTLVHLNHVLERPEHYPE